MTEIEKENKENPQAPPAAASAVQSQATAVKSLSAEDIEQEKNAAIVSPGEKWYNRIVYQGINYWLNLGISLLVTDFFAHGRGKGFFESGVKHISDGLTASKMTRRVTSNRIGEILLSTFTLNSGGNLLLIPTKFLEDRKRPVVHWLNKNIFHEKQLAPDGHEETPDEIYIKDEQLPQSWERMIWRRALGFGATTATGLVIDKVLARKLATPIGVNGDAITHKPGQQVFTDATVKGAGYVLNSGYIPGGKAFAASPAAQRYMGYAALDWIYTIITSTILHKTNGAGKGKMPKEIGDDFDPPVISATDVVETLPPQPIAQESGANAKSAKLRADPAHKRILAQSQPLGLSDKIAAQRLAAEPGERNFSPVP